MTKRDGVPRCHCGKVAFTEANFDPVMCFAAILETGGVTTDTQPDHPPLPYPKLGMKLRVDSQLAGLVIDSVDVGSVAEEKGISPGALITEVDMMPVASPADVVANISRAYQDGRGAVMMRIDDRFVAIPFSDRKVERSARRQSPPVLLKEPRLVTRETAPTGPDLVLAKSQPLLHGATTEVGWLAPAMSAWLPFVLSLLSGALLYPVITRGYRLLATSQPRFAMAERDMPPPLPPMSGPGPALATPTPVRERDTPAALQAMQLVFAYLGELHAAGAPDPENVHDRKSRLNTLSLTTKQLARAERLDPDAMLEGDGDGGGRYRISLKQLKVQALLAEAITHQYYDVRRSLPPLLAATRLDPHDDTAFYLLGSIHLANKKRGAAIAALTRAVELNPNDMEYRKELDRAQNMSAFEIGGYKASRAGEHALSAGVIIWKILKVFYFPVSICIEACRFAARHSSHYR